MRVRTTQDWVCLLCATRYDAHQRICTCCWNSGCVVALGRRPGAEVDAEPEVTDARDLARASWEYTNCARYPALKLGRGALVCLYGPPGSYKSTMACGLLDGVRGPVLLASVEEPPGPSLAARLLRANVKREDFHVVGRATIDQLVSVLRQTKSAALAIDSVQPAAFTPRDLRHVLAVVPTLRLLVGIAQVNKLGEIAGARTLEHEADVVLRLGPGGGDDARPVGGIWTLEKSRYQPPPLGGRVLEPEHAEAS